MHTSLSRYVPADTMLEPASLAWDCLYGGSAGWGKTGGMKAFAESLALPPRVRVILDRAIAKRERKNAARVLYATSMKGRAMP